MQNQDLNSFVAAARAYCGVIDTLGADDREAFDRLEVALSDLHVSIVRVEMGSGANRDIESTDMSHKEWKAVAGRIELSIGSACWALADYLVGLGGKNEETDDASRARHAWDDFADIYRELRDGLALWDRGDTESRVEAQWHWRFGYEHHWGWHLMRAALTVHQVKYSLRGG